MRSMIQRLVDLGVTRRGRDLAAVAEDRDLVRDRQHVVEEMRDEDDAAARPRAAGAARRTGAPPRAATSAEVGSSRMMMRAPENSTRASSTSCCMPIGRQPDRRLRGSMSMPRPASCSPRLARAWRASRPGPSRVRRLRAQEHVLGDAQVGHDGEFLVHHADAGIAAHRAASGSAPSRPSMRMSPSIAGVHAGDDLHQRDLAGAVLADETVDLAGVEREVHVAQRLDAAEASWRCRPARAAAAYRP